MPQIIVMGGGVSGLATAILLARDGHDVTVLERDAEPPPATLEEAIEGWPRRGVAQFRQAHYMLPRGRTVLDEDLPDLRDALLALLQRAEVGVVQAAERALVDGDRVAGQIGRASCRERV